MSKTVIVEGDLIKRSQGKMELWATEGNYDFTAATENIWTSGEGVNENDYEPIEDKKELIDGEDVLLSLFFDGTQNNKLNTESRMGLQGQRGNTAYEEESNKEDDSYENDFTNVVRGFEATKEDPKQLKIYIEGIGTRDFSDDEVTVVGLGESAIGNSGVKDKVKKACEETANKLSQKGKTINKLTINVFGFSRGAAAARHFLHVGTKTSAVTIYSDPKKTRSWCYLEGENKPHQMAYTSDGTLSFVNGYLGQCLFKKGIKVKKIVFNFAGLYDTVSSYGLYHGNDVRELDLDAVKKVNMVFQIAADDEYRENFDLTNIRSAGMHGLEIKLPGVHSDIGGSYLNNSKETSTVFKEVNRMYGTSNADKFKKILIDEGWYKEDQLLKITRVINQRNDDEMVVLKGTRTLKNTYDRISLLTMITFSKDSNYSEMKYDQGKVDQIKEVIESDSLLKRINGQLSSYINQCSGVRNKYVGQYNSVKDPLKKTELRQQFLEDLEKLSHLDFIDHDDLKLLRNGYLHWSAKVDKFGRGPRTSRAVVHTERKREIQNG